MGTLKKHTMFLLVPLLVQVALTASLLSDPPCETHECQQDGVFPEGKCSEVFCYCSNGNGILEACPSGLVFNPTSLECDYPGNVQGCSFHTFHPTESSSSTPTATPSTPTTSPTATSTTTASTTTTTTTTTAT